MATYAELLSAKGNNTLRSTIMVACVIAAETVRTEVNTTPNHANRIIWAKAVYDDPAGAAESMMWAVLAQNAGAPLASILSASDATVQTAVNAAIDVFAG